MKIGLFREGKRISREQFWVDATAQFTSNFATASNLSKRGRAHGRTSTFDNLVEQLDQMKTIAVAGG